MAITADLSRESRHPPSARSDVPLTQGEGEQSDFPKRIGLSIKGTHKGLAVAMSPDSKK